jgi:hypothetical protein
MQQPKYPQNIVNPGIITYVKMREARKKTPDPRSYAVELPREDAAACEQCARGRYFAVSWFDDAKPTGMLEKLSKSADQTVSASRKRR